MWNEIHDGLSRGMQRETNKQTIIIQHQERMKNMPQKDCYDCKFFESNEEICNVNYRAMCILDATESAKDCSHFEKGTYVDTDEHLLVD